MLGVSQCATKSFSGHHVTRRSFDSQFQERASKCKYALRPAGIIRCQPRANEREGPAISRTAAAAFSSSCATRRTLTLDFSLLADHRVTPTGLSASSTPCDGDIDSMARAGSPATPPVAVVSRPFVEAELRISAPITPKEGPTEASRATSQGTTQCAERLYYYFEISR